MQMYRYVAQQGVPCKAIGVATVDKTAAASYTIYNYAIQGKYISPETPLSINTTYYFTHKLGVPLQYMNMTGSMKNLETSETTVFSPQSNWDYSVNFNNYAGTNQYLDNVRMWVRTGTTTLLHYVNASGTTITTTTANRATLNLVLERAF
jgi:hypothetical protein